MKKGYLKDNKYLLIKLSDSWITNEQIRAMAHYYLGDQECEILENGVVSVSAVRLVQREYYEAHGNDFLTYLKYMLAEQIGRNLMDVGCISFFEEKSSDKVRIRATVNIVDERRKNDA